MLTFNLKKVWYDKIKSGKKTHEYREVKPYWTKRLTKELCVSADELKNYIAGNYTSIELINGYNRKNGIKYGFIRSIKIVNGLNTDLKINAPVYDIHFELTNKEYEDEII